MLGAEVPGISGRPQELEQNRLQECAGHVEIRGTVPRKNEPIATKRLDVVHHQVAVPSIGVDQIAPPSRHTLYNEQRVACRGGLCNQPVRIPRLGGRTDHQEPDPVLDGRFHTDVVAIGVPQTEAKVHRHPGGQRCNKAIRSRGTRYHRLCFLLNANFRRAIEATKTTTTTKGKESQ